MRSIQITLHCSIAFKSVFLSISFAKSPPFCLKPFSKLMGKLKISRKNTIHEQHELLHLKGTVTLDQLRPEAHLIFLSKHSANCQVSIKTERQIKKQVVTYPLCRVHLTNFLHCILELFYQMGIFHLALNNCHIILRFFMHLNYMMKIILYRITFLLEEKQTCFSSKSQTS